MDPRNLTHVDCESSAWFITLNTEFSYYLQIIYYSIYTLGNAHLNPPLFLLLIPLLLTRRTSFFAHGANTHPLSSLVC